MARKVDIQLFSYPANDSLAVEHAAIENYAKELIENFRKSYYFHLSHPKQLTSGKALLASTPVQACRMIVAVTEQSKHWEQQISCMHRNSDQLAAEKIAFHFHQLINVLLRRSLPFNQSDLEVILDWCLRQADRVARIMYHLPIAGIHKAIAAYTKKHPFTEQLVNRVSALVEKLRASYDKQTRKHIASLALLLDQSSTEKISTTSYRPAPQPSLAGTSQVLSKLKCEMGLQNRETTPCALVDIDQFPLRDDSPLRNEHELVTRLIQEESQRGDFRVLDLMKSTIGQEVLRLSPAARGKVLLAAAERFHHVRKPDDSSRNYWTPEQAARRIFKPILKSDFTLDRAELFDLLLFLTTVRHGHGYSLDISNQLEQLINRLKQEVNTSPLTEGEKYVLYLWRRGFIGGFTMGYLSGEVAQLTHLIGDGLHFFLIPGFLWSDAINEELSSLSEQQRHRWIGLFQHCGTATSSRPNDKWKGQAKEKITLIGEAKYRVALDRWLPHALDGKATMVYDSDPADALTSVVHDDNSIILRGLLWTIPLLKDTSRLEHCLTALALTAFKKLPGVGARAAKVGNACIYALSAIGTTEAVGQLALLKVRVRQGSAQKEIEKAYDSAAATLALPRDEIEELSVPSYGLDVGGRFGESFGEHRAEVVVNGSAAEVSWYDAAGKRLKSTPAKVKKDHKSELKELQQSVKDIQSMLPAQRDRLDSLFLLKKSWPISNWRERYHDHPLVGTIARRLIWCVDGRSCYFESGKPCDVNGKAIEHGKTAEITLWHPIGRSIEEIITWRQRLETLGITQPFKQAYREVYLLTEAERNTNSYSNRFAAHILRQHQFNALCAARGWKNQLRLMVDTEYRPPTKLLPLWNLRAEYRVEGIGNEYGVDTNETGVYLRLVTDQVRFYRLEAAENRAHDGGAGDTRDAQGRVRNTDDPLPLDQIPLLVFSEIMRDVDLFVGVTSIGNDETWHDGGQDGHVIDYLGTYRTGELNGTSITRKQVLERLVPRLKIASRCSFTDRFLIVKGDRRNYKIHLGSSTIFMEPDDRYLCIVPNSVPSSVRSGLYLPFEGDNMLSIILSKALLLADESQIKDPSILCQINY